MRQFFLLICILGIFGFVGKTVTGEKFVFRYTKNDVSKNDTVESEAEHDAPKKSFWRFCVEKWEEFWEWRWATVVIGTILGLLLVFGVFVIFIIIIRAGPGDEEHQNQNGGGNQDNGNNPHQRMDPAPAAGGAPRVNIELRPLLAGQQPAEVNVGEPVDQDPPPGPAAVSGADSPPSQDIVIEQTTPEAHV